MLGAVFVVLAVTIAVNAAVVWAVDVEGLAVPLVAVLGVGAAGIGAAYVVLQRVLYRRMGRLMRTLERVAEGNVYLRAETGTDEIGTLGAAVNTVLHRLTDLSVSRLDTVRELNWTQKELKLQDQLEEKTKLLESSNQQLENRVRDLNVLFSISKVLNASLDPQAVISTFLKTASGSMDSDKIAILVHDEHRNVLTVAKVHGFGDAERLVVGMTIRPGEGVSGTAYQRKSLVYIRDLDSDDRFLHFRGKVRMKGSALALPLLSGDRCVGVILFNRPSPDAFSMDDVGLLHVVSSQLGAALANALLFQRTEELASHDQLTGLFNRRSFEERLEMEWERATRFNTHLACLMIDVDHFKKFNDTYGHLVGDDVLRHVGARLLSQLRKVDFVARYGGEEFVALLPRAETPEAAAVAEKLRSAVASLPLDDPGRGDPLSLTISIGVATYQHGPQSPRQLIDWADLALLEAKGGGRNRVVVFGAT